jgi:agmatine deiminase
VTSDIQLTLNATPHALGYHMPAEWEPHTATWIAWPHNASDWPGRFQPIPWVYAEIVRQLAAVEQVHILVQNADGPPTACGHATPARSS